MVNNFTNINKTKRPTLPRIHRTGTKNGGVKVWPSLLSR